MPESHGKNTNNSAHYLLGSLFFVAGLLVLIFVINLQSRANDSSTQVNVTNSPPTVNTVYFSETSEGAQISDLSLNENTSKTLYIYGSYTDDNGCSDVTSLNFTLYGGSSIGGANCPQNDLNCYNQNSTGYSCNFTSVASDQCTGGTDTTANYVCSVPVQYFADATDDGPYSANDWVARVTATDNSSSTGYLDSALLTVNTLTALDVGSSINYGSLALGATSAADVPLPITNTGNKIGLNVNASGTNMTCTAGSIPASNQHYSTLAGQLYSYTLALNTFPTLISFGIPKAASVSSPSTENLYWRLQIPSTGINGSCTGTSTFSAI